MNPALHGALMPRLLRDYRFRESADKKFLRQGECPSCGKKELYAPAESPWVLRCGRLNKCGAEFHVKELYPDLFENWSARHPQTAQSPNAAADAYLADGRGFDLAKIKGWYVQESYWSRERDAGSATVRFALPGNAWWERIIDQPQRFGDRKASFRGEYAGMWWQPPSLGEPAEIWITEGIFDAIALMHHGIAAVAAMSSVNYPGSALKALAAQYATVNKPRPKLVWALDGDKAGQAWAVKHHARSVKEGWEAAAATIPQQGPAKLDWNDLHQRERLTAKHLEQYRYQGSLLLAATAYDKALLIFEREGKASFPFEYDGRLYWFKLDLEKLSKAQMALEDRYEEEGTLVLPEKLRRQAIEQAGGLAEICNCVPRPLYHLKNVLTDESWYYFRVDFPHDGEAVKNTFTSGQLAANTEFKKRLLHVGPGAFWSGNQGQLDFLAKRWLENVKRVDTIDFIGYSLPHGCYVFNQVAVKDGRVVEMNDEDYFELGKLAIKSLSRANKFDIETDPKAKSADWFDRFYLCFGPKGIIALAAWMGSLFAEQIRDRFESFPFIEIVGEPGAGKTTLLETLWKLLGRNGYEGFDPLKGSQVGFLRSMAQVSNLPVVLIESDREEDPEQSKGRPRQAFHWDSLKSLYNGGSLRTTGVKSSGNDTYDPQFRAALVISQNAAVQASTAIMERIVHLGFDKSRQSEAGREAALELGRMPARELSGFLIRSITQEAAVLAILEQQQRPFEKRLEATGVKNQRIQKNHAQLMAMVNALSLACPITESQKHEAIALLANLAQERERDLALDHPIVERFWETFEYLNGAGDENDPDCIAQLNHSRDPNVIAVNLNHFIELATEKRQQIPPLADLKRLLKTSRRYKFIESNAVVSSAINGRYNSRREAHWPAKPASVRCWRFSATQRR